MKSNLTFLKSSILTTLFFLCSCSQKKEIISIFENLTPLTKEVIEKSTLEEMRQGMAMLSIEERSILWKTKLNFILSNPRERFSLEQRNIVLMLKSFLDIHGMEKLMKNSELGRNFLSKNLAYFGKHFSKEQLNILIESPYFPEDLLISKVDLKMIHGLISVRNQNKEKSTSLNSLRVEQGSCTCIYDLGCPGPYNYCENTGCVVNNNYEMCGLFGTSSCEKRCSGEEPNLDPDPNGGNPLKS